ncbi:MAG TPA: hypothetical protein VLV29_04090 [Steroidobacteraceae bacterium]|nr:hypothetical protein [Steroidobacteraceae bacterium]
MSARGLLDRYRQLFCWLIVLASVQILLSGHAAAAHGVSLATTEILGALLLLGRRTQWLGLALLLLAFAGAQLLAALGGEWPTRFLQYAASALLIVLMDRALGAPAGAAGSGAAS